MIEQTACSQVTSGKREHRISNGRCVLCGWVVLVDGSLRAEKIEAVDHPTHQTAIKTCYRCKAHLAVEFFTKRSRARDGFESICKACRSEVRKNESQENRYAYFRAYRTDKRHRLNAFKEEHGCSTCAEKDPRCLQFHHRDPAQKVRSISRMYGGTWCWEQILAEIEKCIVICANCHLKLHRDEDDEKRIK